MAHAVVQLMKAIGVQIGAYEEGFETLCGRDDVVLINLFTVGLPMLVAGHGAANG